MNKDLGKESKIGIMCATARELAPYLSVMQIRKTDELLSFIYACFCPPLRPI